MGVLAANLVNAEGHAGAAIITRAASKTQANADFATELVGRLAFDSGPTDPTQITVPEEAPGTEKPFNDGKPRQEATVPSTGSPDATPSSGSVPATTTPKSDARSGATRNPMSTFHLNSTLPALPAEHGLQAPSAVTVVPKKTNSNLPQSRPAQNLATPQEQPASPGPPKPASADYELPYVSSSPFSPSRLTQDSDVPQQRPEVTNTVLEPPAAVSSTNSSRLNKSPEPWEVDTPAQRPNVATQFGPPRPPGGETRKSEGSQSKGSNEVAISPAMPAVIATPVQPTGLAPTDASEQNKLVDVAGPAEDQVYPAHGANLSKSSDGAEGTASATLSSSQNAVTQAEPLVRSTYAATAVASPSQNAMTEPEPLAPSSYATTAHASSIRSRAFAADDISPGRTDALDAPSVSRLSNGQRSVLAETASSSPGVTPPSQAQAFIGGVNPVGPKGSSRPDDTSSNLAIKTATSLRSPTTESKLQNAPSLDYPKSAAPLENGPRTSTTNQGGPTDANPTTGTLKTARGFTSKQAEADSAGELNLSRDPSATDIASRLGGTSTESLNAGTQPTLMGTASLNAGTQPTLTSTASLNAGTQPTLTSPHDGTRSVGAQTSTEQSATHPQAQAPSGTPQSAAPQQLASNGESAPGTYDPVAPSDDEPMIFSAVPDYSLSPESGLTKAPSSLAGYEPARPGRTKNPQEGSNTAPGTSGDASPIPTPDALAPAQNQDSQAAPSARDKRQSEASGHKGDTGTVPDLAKAADANPGLSKTRVDSPAAPQLGLQAPAQAGRAAAQVIGASQDRAEPAGANLSSGYEPALPGAVSSARLTQQAGSAEMQVRLRTEALGAIDVHTVVKGSDIGASIHVEARDTQVMMASEISRLEQALSERNLRVQRLDVLQGSVSGGQPGGTGPGNYHGNPSQPRPGSTSHSVVEAYPTLPETSSVYDEGSLGLSTTRINLRV